MSPVSWQNQYTGQVAGSDTAKKLNNMAARHRGHRNEIKSSQPGLGEHFHQHAIKMGMDPKVDKILDTVMNFFRLTIIGSVEETKPGAAARLDRLEADMQHRLMTMEIHGGMNIRDENKRGKNRT